MAEEGVRAARGPRRPADVTGGLSRLAERAARRLTSDRGEDRRRLQERLAAQEKRIKELQSRLDRTYDDVDREVLDIYRLVRPYTMTGRDKTIGLVTAVRHLARTGLAGDFVECGVWRGGSVHAMVWALVGEGVLDRDIHLFDTFDGMTAPTDEDVRADGRRAAELLAEQDRTRWVWAVAPRAQVEEGLRTLPYPYERFHLVEGKVEDTVPGLAPERIALLRLDTDWYESTKHELEHLYDRIVPGGVLIIDDYGSWKGSRRATDDFLAGLEHPPLMQRAGRARIGVKP